MPKNPESPVSMHDYPSLAAFVRLRRMSATSLSVRAASSAAFSGKEDTWGALESGRLPRTNLRYLHAIAQILALNPWPLAIIGGNKPGLKLLRVGDLLMPRLPQSPWWNLRAGSFIRLVRESSGHSLENTAKAWETHWPTIPALSEPTAWETMESQGLLPNLPVAPGWAKQPSPTKNLATASGGWWWALLWAVCGDPEWAYYLLPGLSVAAGEAIGQIASGMDAQKYFEHLIAAYKAAYATHPETFEDEKYFAAAIEVARDMQRSAGAETATQRLLRVESAWNHLSAEQQSYIASLVEDLTKKNLP